MQYRILALVILLTLLVSYRAYTLTTDVYAEAEKHGLYAEAEKYTQIFENSVGLSPSPVQPIAREGQELLAESAKGGGIKQDSQGGKQESLSRTLPTGSVLAGYKEAVAELVQSNAPVKPAQKSAEIYKWVDNNGTVHFSDQRKGELVELGNSVSYVNTDVPEAADR